MISQPGTYADFNSLGMQQEDAVSPVGKDRAEQDVFSSFCRAETLDTAQTLVYWNAPLVVTHFELIYEVDFLYFNNF